MQTFELQTKIGKFTGISCESTFPTKSPVEKFLGIRYAKAKRFEKPELVNTYDNYDATKYGASCPQQRTFYPEDKNAMYFREFREGIDFSYDEDCLFLNIFRPSIIEENSSEKNKKLPVLIYIHGGSFTRGSSAEKPFDGSNLASHGIIVVTINYRLNIFGTWMGKNLMLYDMKAAIEWVYSHIEEFGGDSQNITLSGQSAGGMSVQQLILNEEIQKMVKRAIMISSGGMLKGIFAPKNQNLAKSFYKDVEKDLKKRSLDPLNCTPEQLFESFYKISKKRPINATLCAVFPTFDEELVKKSSIKGKSKCTMYCILSVTKDDLNPRFYLEKSALKYHKALRKAGKKSGIIFFNHDLPGDKDNNDPYKKGAFHSSDLWYFFGNMDSHSWRKFTDEDKKISENIMKNITVFCISGSTEFFDSPNNIIYIF